MSHYHLEMILPPEAADRIEDAIAEVLAPFCEHRDDAAHTFWDWWVIGGRYSGKHVLQRYEPNTLAEFWKWCQDAKVQVSSLTFGKQTLMKEWQEPVDAKWNELFPGSGLDRCPLFDSFNDRHETDVCKVSELGQWSNSYQLIIAGPSFNYDPETKDGEFTLDRLKAREMVAVEHWNGVGFVESKWEGSTHDFLATDKPSPGTKDLATVTDDWLAVTIDYHS